MTNIVLVLLKDYSIKVLEGFNPTDLNQFPNLGLLKSSESLLL